MRSGEIINYCLVRDMRVEEADICLHAVFHGTVQGVSFRAYAKRFADRGGVKGWIRNMSDGSVEAVFQGRRDAVYSVLEQCRNGNPYARVTRVDASEIACTDSLQCFTIR